MKFLMAPPNLVELEARITDAIGHLDSRESLSLLDRLAGEAPDYYRAHMEMEHTIPSPSGVMRCLKQQYLKATGVEEETEIPAAWWKRAAMGTLLEPFWFAVLRMAGLDLELWNNSIACGPHMRGYPDAAIGAGGLLELKDKTGFAFKRILEAGDLHVGEERDYYQTQSYLHGTGRDWTLYVASPADPGMLQSQLRNYKAYGPTYELPLVYMEIVYPNEAAIAIVMGRAATLTGCLERKEVPPCEFAWQSPLKRDGRKSWPRGYCPFPSYCGGE